MVLNELFYSLRRLKIYIIALAIIISSFLISCNDTSNETANLNNQTDCNVTCDRTFSWSGFTWCVKNTNESKCSPGPNYFSQSSENVWVDSAGELHLRITKRNDRYYCAEVFTTDKVGYGEYTFYISSRVDNLDKNVVAGMFTWNDNDCRTNANSEIDIEFARWGEADDSTVIEYSVQPTNAGAETDRFTRWAMQSGSNSSVHFLNWTPSEISWSSYSGFVNLSPKGNLIASWSFDSTNAPKSKIECNSDPVIIPQPEIDTGLDLNLWLDRGNFPSNNEEIELIMHRVDFSPSH